MVYLSLLNLGIWPEQVSVYIYLLGSKYASFYFNGNGYDQSGSRHCLRFSGIWDR